LSPIFPGGSQFEEAGDARDDEDEVADAAGEDHRGVGAGEVISVQKDPELTGAGLEEMRNEYAEAIPRDCDDGASAVAPGAISTREDEHGYVNQRLKKMQEAELSDDGGGDCEGEKEERDTDQN
jgi:hypothetical protein